MQPDSFDRLAAALNAPRTPVSAVRKKKERPPPDRSRDHAVYAAPHRPPARSQPLFEKEKEIITFRRQTIPPPDALPARRVPRLAALGAAVVGAAIAFGLAILAGVSP